ncbi:MAG: V-type ATP synthase subunit E [Verrucomicrobia bacterium]|nr:V-type ATP synthase subunit E [Verrucomicrobiota bacterium]
MTVKSLQTGKEKIQKICDLLRRETIEPAQADAERIKQEAEAEAQEILAKAHAQAAEIESAAKQRVAKEKAIFTSAMEQGVRQSLQSLKQEIENTLFSDQLGKLITSASGDPKLMAALINAIVKAVEKEGLSTDLEVLIPKVVDRHAVEMLLLEQVRSKLQQGLFLGGVKVRLVDQNVAIDVSDEALKELLSHHIRKDFRNLLFGR